jgi:RNA polymerase sigma-70 factor (ECF subfamily)
MTLHDTNLENLSHEAAGLPFDTVAHSDAALAWQYMDDTQFVRMCQAELPYVTDVFEALVHRYESLVFHSCRHALGNPADAEEAIQDIFVRIFHALPRFEGRASFRTWLFRIVHNYRVTKRGKLIGRAKQKDAYLQAFPDNW